MALVSLVSPKYPQVTKVPECKAKYRNAGSSKGEDAVIETHRQRLQDRVAETSQLMEELSRQKQVCKAFL